MTFGIGQAMPRTEDVRLLTGAGRFAGDIRLADTAHTLFLRSSHAHAEVLHIDMARARSEPGVLAVFTGADQEAGGLGDIPCHVRVVDRDGRELPRPGRPLLAKGESALSASRSR